MLFAIARIFYSSATTVLCLVLLPLFFLSARGRARLWERFGLWNLPQDTYLWFHGASLGEINGLLPIIRRLRADNPTLRCLLTATSVTGLERAATEVHETRLLPFDSFWNLERALGASRVKMLIISETELWPALICTAKAHGAALCLVNGIISDYSIRWYRCFRILLAPLLRQFNVILCASAIAQQRFIALGADPKIVSVTGNSKYDHEPSVKNDEAARQQKKRFFKSEAPVLVLGSLRPGEESFWFPEISGCLKAGQQLLVVVAPRHKEKFEFFAQRLRDFQISFERGSTLNAATNQNVMLLDTFGDLEACYSFADVAFVGGSMIDWGGHNPLEPACYGACIAMGPFARNVAPIVEDMVALNCLIRVENGTNIRELLEKMNTSLEMLRAGGQSAKAVWSLHRGATEKIVEKLQNTVR